MDRRTFIGSCSAGATAVSAALAAGTAAWPAFGADARPRAYARALLVDEFGDPLRAARLQPRTTYVFHYPYVATPVFLLELGKPAQPTTLRTRERQTYRWAGGVGPRRSLVAFSAICAHQLVYPTRELSFIRYRQGLPRDPRTPGKVAEVIHCCAEHSQYDPARGAQVLDGPAEQPLCAILLEHDAQADTLTATGTLGGELFDEFFRKYEFKLSLEVGPTARRPVEGRSTVRELDRFSRNAVQC